MLAAVVRGEPLDQILASIVRMAEEVLPGSLCSILRYDATAAVLRHVAAPSLPETYTRAIDGVPVKAHAGACGAAAWRNEPVFVADIARDPLWADGRDVALAHGLRACWATPINGRSGEVLGIFAVYFRARRAGAEAELGSIRSVVYLAAVAMEHEAALDAVSAGERLLCATADAMRTLVTEPDLARSVDLALRSLGDGTLVDRVYLFEIHAESDRRRDVVSQRAEWVREGIEPQIDNPTLQSLAFSDLLPTWDAALRRGEAVAVTASEMDATALAILEDEDIQSLLLVPVQVEGAMWGFLGFDDCRRERRWSGPERSVLQAVGAALGAAHVASRTEAARAEAEELLRSSEKRFRVLADTAPVLIWMAATDGQLTYVNKSWQDFTGRTAGEELGAGWVQMVHPDDLHRCLSTKDAAVLSRVPYEMEYRLRRYDDQYRWIIDRGTPRFGLDGILQGYIGTCIDIEDRKRHEEQLLSARLAAEEVARLKSGLLANMSHEIRTPLTAIIGFADILASEATGTHAELADYIGSGGRRLLETLNSVLDFAELEASTGHLKLESIPTGDLLREQARLMQHRAQEEGLSLVVTVPEEPIAARGNAGAFGRSIANLLSNAIKFTESGQIEINGRRVEGWIEVSVSDTGVGIAEAFLPHLFDEFRQESEGLSREYEGNGLGLAITRKLVEAMDGTISVETEKGHGSTFTIRLHPAEAQGGEPT